MEFIGQIIKVCEPRTGVSDKTGNEWKTLGFVFEFKEHDTDPWHDKVYLETFDTNIMQNLVEGAIAKVGFRHSIREYNGRFYNEVRMNKFELVGKPMEANMPANQPAQGANGQQVNNTSQQAIRGPQTPPFPPQTDANGNPINKEGEKGDDLPF